MKKDNVIYVVFVKVTLYGGVDGDARLGYIGFVYVVVFLITYLSLP